MPSPTEPRCRTSTRVRGTEHSLAPRSAQRATAPRLLRRSPPRALLLARRPYMPSSRPPPILLAVYSRPSTRHGAGFGRRSEHALAMISARVVRYVAARPSRFPAYPDGHAERRARYPTRCLKDTRCRRAFGVCSWVARGVGFGSSPRATSFSRCRRLSSRPGTVFGNKGTNRRAAAPTNKRVGRARRIRANRGVFLVALPPQPPSTPRRRVTQSFHHPREYPDPNGRCTLLANQVLS